MTKVSIGLPVFNGEAYLKEAIEALLSQTHRDLEIIISDNASTDGTQKICMGYASEDARIRYFRQDTNLGAVRNFEFVLKQATAEYFAWAAADDLRSEDFVSRLLATIETRNDIACAMSDVVVREEGEQKPRIEKLETIRVADNESLDHNRSAFFVFPNTNVFFCIYGLFRRSILEEVVFPHAKKYLDGTELPILAQVACMGRLVSIPEPLFEYCKRSTSVYQVERIQTPGWIARYNYHIRRPLFLVSAAWNSKLPLREKFSCIWLTVSSAAKAVIGASARRIIASGSQA